MGRPQKQFLTLHPGRYNFFDFLAVQIKKLIFPVNRAPKNSIWAPTKKFTKNGLPVIYCFGWMHDFYIKVKKVQVCTLIEGQVIEII